MSFFYEIKEIYQAQIEGQIIAQKITDRYHEELLKKAKGENDE